MIGRIMKDHRHPGSAGMAVFLFLMEMDLEVSPG